MIRVNIEGLFTLAPEATDVYRRAFRCGEAMMACFGLLANSRRPTHFLAQILHESGGLRLFEENLNYNPQRLMQVWPARFKTLATAQQYAHQPERLANKVYGGRLGNTEPGDGWKFRGRGLLQITGRDNYWRIGQMLDLDLVAQPGLVVSERYAMPIAMAVWKSHGCNPLADTDDVRKVTKAINGGLNGLDSRRLWLARTRGLVFVE